MCVCVMVMMMNSQPKWPPSDVQAIEVYMFCFLLVFGAPHSIGVVRTSII